MVEKLLEALCRGDDRGMAALCFRRDLMQPTDVGAVICCDTGSSAIVDTERV